MPSAPSLLVVDDDPHVRTGLCDILNHHEYKTHEAGDGRSALTLMEERPVDLVLLDLDLPRLSGMQVLESALESHPALPIIIVSGKGTIQHAVRATKIGAYDFIEKPVDAQRMLVTVRNALEKRTLQQQRDHLVNEARARYRMVGSSNPMQRLYTIIDKASRTASKILITGENGVGKELVARAIHHNSSRAGEPFVTVNCAALPESLIESELFGHRKGAFTGAAQQRQGKFISADGGTLFLDEIGDMELNTQSKTLRALEDQAVHPVCADDTIQVDARIIAATNKDLTRAVDEGSFRRDLYYRLNVITINVPPLRERRSDIPDLVAHFLHKFSTRNGIHTRRVDGAGLTLLMSHDWPGNVRQLRNVIERLVALSDAAQIPATAVADALGRHDRKVTELRQTDLRAAREQFERAFIRRTLDAQDGQIQSTAEALGISRSHLWRKMQKYEIESPSDT